MLKEVFSITQENNYKEIGQRLRELRGELSQTAFGEPIGYKYSYVKNVEHGTKPSLEYLLKVAEYYNASLDWILRGIASNSANNFIEDGNLKTQKVEAIFDPDLKEMIEVVKHVMDTDNQEQRTWAKFQLKRAFSEFSAAVEEKKQHA